MTLNLFAQQAVSGTVVQDRRAIIDEVIRAVNQEFTGSSLRSPADEDRQKIIQKIQSLTSLAYRSRSLTAASGEQNELADEIARRVMGLGFLDLLLPPARTDISEITIYSNGLIQVMPKGDVRWVDAGLEVEAEEVWRVLNVILGPQSKAATEATPVVSAKLPRTPQNPGGGRIHILHPVVAPGNGYPALNIRLFEQKPVKPDWLLERRLMSDEMMAFLGQAMNAGRRILICGPTRTGKTTLLSALCNYLPHGYRILKIEDPEEIWIDRRTVQAIEARHAARGSEMEPVTLADGVDATMRKSPDYLIVGEVRDGAAVMALFRALTTGHAGASTLHAESPSDALLRLRHLMREDRDVSDRYAAETISRGIDLMVQIGIRPGMEREQRVSTSITRLRKKLDGKMGYTWLWRYEEDSPPGVPRWRKYTETEAGASVIVGEGDD